MRPIFIIFSLIISERIHEGIWNYDCHFPSRRLPHYLALPCSTIQVCSTAKSDQTDAKRFHHSKITVDVHEGCYFLVCVCRLFTTTCVKNARLLHVLNRAWSMDVSIERSSMLCQTFVVRSEKRVYRNKQNITLMS